MRARPVRRQEQSPALRFRLEIRKRQQHQIKSTIIGKYHLIEAMHDCLARLEALVSKLPKLVSSGLGFEGADRQNLQEVSLDIERVLANLGELLQKQDLLELEEILAASQAQKGSLLPQLTRLLSIEAPIIYSLFSFLDIGLLPLLNIACQLSYCHSLAQQYCDSQTKLLQLICSSATCMVRPGPQFFRGLVAIGNILTLCIEEANDQGSNIEGQQKARQAYQMLEDVCLEDVLRARLVLQVDDFNQEIEAQVDENQGLYLWLISIYTKWLAAYSLPIYSNKLFTKDLTEYICFHLCTIARANQTLKLSGAQYKKFKQLHTILLYSGISLDNVVIVNRVLPLVRANWHRADVVAFWLLLTSGTEYNLPELICMQGRQDRKTVKKQQVRKAHKKQGSDQDGDTSEGSQAEERARQDSLDDSLVSQVSALVVEILESIVEVEQHRQDAQSSRNKLKSILNLFLEMQWEQARNIWQRAYASNQHLSSRLDQLECLSQQLQEIQDYLGIEG